MATIFFARSGKDPSRTDSGREISMERVQNEFNTQDIRYSKSPPVINDHEQPSPYSGFKHVVISVDTSEINDKFPKAGYYWLPNLSPEECTIILGESDWKIK